MKKIDRKKFNNKTRQESYSNNFKKHISNKFLKFKKEFIFVKKKAVSKISSFVLLKLYYYKKMGLLSKMIITLRNYYKSKTNNFFKNPNFINRGKFKFFKKFLNINFYRLWILKYRFLRFFSKKVVYNIKMHRFFRNARELTAHKKKDNKAKVFRKKRKKKKIKKFLFKKIIFQNFKFRRRTIKKLRFKTRKFFSRYLFKFRKLKFSKIIRLKYFLKNNFFIKKILYKKLKVISRNYFMKRRIRGWRLKKRFFLRRKKRRLKKKNYKIFQQSITKRLKFRKFEYFITKILFDKLYLNKKNKKLVKSIKFKTLISDWNKYLKQKYDFDFFKLKNKLLLKKKLQEEMNYNIFRPLWHFSFKKKNGGLKKSRIFSLIVRASISNWKAKKKAKKLFGVNKRKLRIYYNLQKSYKFIKKSKKILKVRSVFFKNRRFLNDRFLFKVFTLFKIYLNKIVLLNKGILSLKLKDKIYSRFYYLEKLVKFIRFKNYEIKKKMKKLFVFDYKKNREKLVFKPINNNIFSLNKNKDMGKNKKSKNNNKTAKSKPLIRNEDASRNITKKTSKLYLKKKMHFVYKNIKFNREKLKKNTKKKTFKKIYGRFFFKNLVFNGIEYFLSKLFSKFINGGNKSFSKKIMFSFFFFLKKKYFLSSGVCNWVNAYIFQVFEKLTPIFGYMFIRHKRDMLKVPKLFKFTYRYFNNGISMTVNWIQKCLLKRPEKTLLLRLISEFESIRMNKSEAIKMKKEYYFEIKNNFRKVWRKLKLVK